MQPLDPEAAFAAGVPIGKSPPRRKASMPEPKMTQEQFTGLIERSKTEPGAAFEPEILDAIEALKQSDVSGYETLLAGLKKAGVRVLQLERAISGQSDDSPKTTQTDLLIEIAKEVDLFESPDGIAYADVQINGHRETWPIKGSGFKRWLCHEYFKRHGGAPGSDAKQNALAVIEAKAQFENPTARAVHTRVAEHDGRLYLDLANDGWQAIEIDADGWRVVAAPPVRFRRKSGMLPLPMPITGGSIELLRPFMNVANNDDFILAVSWMLAALRPTGPYPVAVTAGEQGSAKSTFSALLNRTIDPNEVPLRALPRNPQDLFLAAKNAHVQTFDNVSGLPPWLSDTLAQLSTGGGFRVRQLYSDDAEVLFKASRPVVLNGITDFVRRPDLADRAVFFNLDRISDFKRKLEIPFWEEFAQTHPEILGALLDGVSHGIAALPTVELERLPRMADFARWGVACEGAFWEAGAFTRAYDANRASAVDTVLSGDMVASAIRELMGPREAWEGTMTDLLGDLTDRIGERASKSQGWPRQPNALSNSLKRSAAFLRKAGIEVVHLPHERHDLPRMIRINSFSSQPVEAEKRSSVSSVSSETTDATDATDATDDLLHTQTGSAEKRPTGNQGDMWADDDDNVDIAI